MQIKNARFQCSSQRVSQLPKDDLRDIAFIGRSNVGKSSLINRLTGRQGLAKVSGTPGKTRLINHFRIDDAWYLVDLPGYGYARTSKAVRGQFSKLITDYVLHCRRLHYLFVLVDIRLEPQRIDLDFIEMLGMHGIPFGILFTKADKLSKAQRERSVARFGAVLAEQWEELPPMLVTSSASGAGRQEVLDLIGRCLAADGSQEEEVDAANDSQEPAADTADGNQEPEADAANGSQEPEADAAGPEPAAQGATNR